MDKITLKKEYFDGIQWLDETMRYKVVYWVISHFLYWEDVELSDTWKFVFDIIKKYIDKDIEVRELKAKWGKNHKWNQYTRLKVNTVQPTPKEEIEDELFNEFWSKYPRPNNREACKIEFSKLTEEKKKKAIEQISVWNNSVDWRKEWGKYIHWSLKYLQDMLYERTPKQNSWKKIAWDIDPIDWHEISEREAKWLTVWNYKRKMELPNTNI